jgi:hypothetical protein
MPAQFVEDPTIGSALAGIGDTIMGGPMLQLKAASAYGDLMTKNLERQKLQQQMDTERQLGQSTTDLFNTNIQPGANAAPPAVAAPTTNVWGDVQPQAAPPAQANPQVDVIRQKKVQYYRDAIAAAIAKGDYPQAQKLQALGAMDVAGHSPADLGQRELAKAQGVDIPAAPLTPGSNDEVARSTLYAIEQKVQSGQQLSPQEAFAAHQAGNQLARAKTSVTTVGGLPTYQTSREFQPWSPALAGQLAGHHLDVSGAMMPQQPSVGAAPLTQGAPSTPPQTPAVQLQLAPGADYVNRETVLKSPAYQDAKTASDAAQSIVDAYTTPRQPGEPGWFRDQAALSKMREAVQAKQSRMVQLGATDVSQSQSYLKNIEDLLSQVGKGRELSPEVRMGIVGTAVSTARSAQQAYEAEVAPTRGRFTGQQGINPDIAVPKFSGVPSYDITMLGGKAPPSNSLNDLRRRLSVPQ